MTSIVLSVDKNKDFKQICNEKTLGFKTLKFDDLDEKKREERFCFHILSDAISDECRQKLADFEKALSEIYPCTIQIHIFKDEDFEVFKPSGAAQSSKLPYYRLKSLQALDEDVKKFLYLDSDMLCLCDIRELFALDLEHKILAAVSDLGSNHKKIKLKNPSQVIKFDANYFNSGFLLVNVPEYKKARVEQRCEELARRCYYIKAADQDLLNAVVGNDYLKLDYAYNFVSKSFCYAVCKDENKRNSLNYTRAEFLKSLEKPKIIHLNEKPWRFLKAYRMKDGQDCNTLWWQYASKTPVFSDELLEFKKSLKEHLLFAALGYEALKNARSLAFLKLFSLILNDKKDNNFLEKLANIDEKDFDISLILGEVILHLRKRKKNLLSVIFKVRKIIKDFERYRS